MKANQRALNNKNMKTLFGATPHPTYQQIRKAMLEKKQLRREIIKQLNTHTFSKKTRKKRKRRDKITKQIDNGFEIAKKLME